MIDIIIYTIVFTIAILIWYIAHKDLTADLPTLKEVKRNKARYLFQCLFGDDK